MRECRRGDPWSCLGPGSSRFGFGAPGAVGEASVSLCPAHTSRHSPHAPSHICTLVHGPGWGGSLSGRSWGDGLRANEAAQGLVFPGLGGGEGRRGAVSRHCWLLGAAGQPPPSSASWLFPCGPEMPPTQLLLGTSPIRVGESGEGWRGAGRGGGYVGPQGGSRRNVSPSPPRQRSPRAFPSPPHWAPAPLSLNQHQGSW